MIRTTDGLVNSFVDMAARTGQQDYLDGLGHLVEGHQELPRNSEDMSNIFRRCASALQPLAQGNAQIAELREAAVNRLRESRHLQGANLRDAHQDVFRIFVRILILLNMQQQQERIDRQLERDLQTKFMEKVAENFSTQGKWLLNTAIGAGVLSILSGVAPILQHSSAGDSVYEFMPKFMKSDAPKEDLFKGWGKMFYAMSEVNKNVGQIHGTYSEGWRTRDHHHSELAKMHNEDWTRALEDDRGYFNNLMQALLQDIQGERDLNQQLCR